MKQKIQLINRAALVRLVILGIILGVLVLGLWLVMLQMPSKSYTGKLPTLTASEISLRDNLRQDVEKLAGEIGERNYVQYDNLLTAAKFIETSLITAGYEIHRQEYKIDSQLFHNIEVEIPGSSRPNEIVIVGGHYDSIVGSPGANDNATGAAAVLALARIFAGEKPERTLRFVEFVNEEPPFFWTPNMGSLVYAKRCRSRGENIVAMLSLETMGYYSEKPGSQQYPPPLNLFYPNKGNFIGFIGNTYSGGLVRLGVGSFRSHAQFPSEGAALPDGLTGVGWSDQWAFWQQGYPGVMVTDTAPFRYPYYHTRNDTVDRVNNNHLAQVVAGLKQVVAELAMV